MVKTSPPDSIGSTARLSVGDGVRGGLFVASYLSWYVAGVVGIAFVVRLLADWRAVLLQLPELLLLSVNVAAGYFVAFALAGALFAALDQLRRKARVLGYAVTGAVLGACIYGVIGVASELLENDPPDWALVGEFTLFMGTLWGSVGMILGVWQ